MFHEAQGSEIWNTVKNSPHVLTTVVKGVIAPKPETFWDDDDQNKVLYDKKTINILASFLRMDEFFRESKICKTAKEIWDTLETTHERTEEVQWFR